MTVWALFDSGNGSYLKGVNFLNRSGGANIDIYPIGMDIENSFKQSQKNKRRKNKMTKTLEEKVKQWFVDRNLHKANPVKQFEKLMEEEVRNDK